MCKFRNYDNYEIYADGRIWSYKTNRFLKPQTSNRGYQLVNLYDNDGNSKTYLLHRVIYETFSGAPIPKNMQINHRSEVKTENMITNLELMSPKQNSNFGSRNSRIAEALSKQVGAFKNGELVMTFKSTQEASRQGFSQSHIVHCCNGERKTHKGYTWRYL